MRYKRFFKYYYFLYCPSFVYRRQKYCTKLNKYSVLTTDSRCVGGVYSWTCFWTENNSKLNT